jgi:hypothetical protein
MAISGDRALFDALATSVSRLTQIRELLGLSDKRDRSCEAVDAIARQHLTEVERKIADLSALRDKLADVIGQCRRRTVADCRIIDALAPNVTG